MFAMFLSMKDFQFPSVLPWHRRDARFQLQKMRNHANNVNTLCTICYHFFNPYDFKSTMKAIELNNKLTIKKDYTDFHVDMKTNASTFWELHGRQLHNHKSNDLPNRAATMPTRPVPPPNSITLIPLRSRDTFSKNWHKWRAYDKTVEMKKCIKEMTSYNNMTYFPNI